MSRQSDRSLKNKARKLRRLLHILFKPVISDLLWLGNNPLNEFETGRTLFLSSTFLFPMSSLCKDGVGASRPPKYVSSCCVWLFTTCISGSVHIGQVRIVQGWIVQEISFGDKLVGDTLVGDTLVGDTSSWHQQESVCSLLRPISCPELKEIHFFFFKCNKRRQE